MAPLASLLPMIVDATVLRRFDFNDVDRFQAYRSDARLALYQGWSPMTPEEARRFVEEMSGVLQFQPGNWIQLAIADHPSKELIGDVGVLIDSDECAAELGFTLRAESQGKGHATRAVAAAVALVNAASSARAVRAITDERNASSIRVLERAGFKQSHTREAVFKGELCRELVYVL
jgi:RimJ/RimL family protein N-acetyltransferase